MYHLALVEQQLRRIGAVMAGHAGTDERATFVRSRYTGVAATQPRASVLSIQSLPMLKDMHELGQVAGGGHAPDAAFLARQTDFIAAVTASGRPVNIKKAHFMVPRDIAQVVVKAHDAAVAAVLDADRFTLCERGAASAITIPSPTCVRCR